MFASRDMSIWEPQGFRFLKDPLFFVSSLFVKKPCRIQGLSMVMTLALRVYAVAQRRLRQPLAHHQETVPNQIHIPSDLVVDSWASSVESRLTLDFLYVPDA
jgi:transposase